MKKLFFISSFFWIFLIIGCASQSPVDRSTTRGQSPLDLHTIFVIAPRAITPPSFLQNLRARVTYTIFDETDLFANQATGYYLILNYNSLSEQQKRNLPNPGEVNTIKLVTTENNPILFLNVDNLNTLTSADYNKIILELENLVTSYSLSNAPRRNPARLNPSQTWEQYFATVFPDRSTPIAQTESLPSSSQTSSPRPPTPNVQTTTIRRPLSEIPIAITNQHVQVNSLEFTLQWTSIEQATVYGIQQANSLEQILSYPEWEETFSTRERGSNQTEITVYNPGIYFFRVRAKQHMNPGVNGPMIWENGSWSEIFSITVSGEPNPLRVNPDSITRDSKPKRPLASAQQISYELIHQNSGKSIVIYSQTTLDEIREAFANVVRFLFVEPHADGQIYTFVLGENDLLRLFTHNRFYDFQAVSFSGGISYKGVSIGSSISETIQALGQPRRTGTDHNWLVYDFDQVRAYIYPESRTIQRLSLSFYQP